MPRDKILRLYCDGAARRAFQTGSFHMARVVERAVEEAGWPVHRLTSAEVPAMPDEGYAIVINLEPSHLFCLNIRNAYIPQFWRIEETNDRSIFGVAKAVFQPAQVDATRAKAFAATWRPKILQGRPVTRDGFIFMPLQGRLLEKRAFQTMSPVEMITATLKADPHRTIRATLHPRETYDTETRAALDRLAQANPRFHLAPGGSLDLLCACDYVVTQTSGMALHGFFAEKPAVLFGRIDFHHAMANVATLGVKAAFETVQGPAPDFEKYLFWFLRWQTIAQFDQAATQKVRDRCQALGWPL